MRWAFWRKRKPAPVVVADVDRRPMGFIVERRSGDNYFLCCACRHEALSGWSFLRDACAHQDGWCPATPLPSKEEVGVLFDRGARFIDLQSQVGDRLSYARCRLHLCLVCAPERVDACEYALREQGLLDPEPQSISSGSGIANVAINAPLQEIVAGSGLSLAAAPVETGRGFLLAASPTEMMQNDLAAQHRITEALMQPSALTITGNGLPPLAFIDIS